MDKMGVINTPDRVRRVEAFHAQLVLKPVECEHRLFVELSEDISVEPDVLFALIEAIEFEVNLKIEQESHLPLNVSELVSSIIRLALLCGDVLFPDEEGSAPESVFSKDEVFNFVDSSIAFVTKKMAE